MNDSSVRTRALIAIFILILLDAYVGFRSFSLSGDSIYFLDVGQADAELIESGGVRILIDAGKNADAAGALERLPEQSKRIDLIVLTHNDTDHAGGIYSLLDRYAVGAILAGASGNWEDISLRARELGIPFIRAGAGDSISWKGSSLRVLWPDRSYAAKNDNDASLVARFDNGSYSALFAGDITGAAEPYIAGTGSADADILKVPHHGSKLSSSEAFLARVTPLISVIEVGKNSYGHPNPETLSRLANIGSAVLRTDEKGTIRVYEADGVLRAEKQD